VHAVVRQPNNCNLQGLIYAIEVPFFLLYANLDKTNGVGLN